MHPILVQIQKCNEIHNWKSTSWCLGTAVGGFKQVPTKQLKGKTVTCFYN